LGSPSEILNRRDIHELNDLTEYANRFHHDTNSAWQTTRINGGELHGYNGGELHGYVTRMLAFAKR
jgi:hypothetical protein